MLNKVEYRYDAATVLSQGRRELQEDAVTKYFPAGSGCGWAVLADGMGGHAAGDVASRIAVDEVFAEITRHAEDPVTLEDTVGNVLHDALDRANEEVARFAEGRPDLEGMGTTLVACVVVGDRLYWISVGDSPLFLLRGQRMIRLNKEHSFANQMAEMVDRGEITAEAAESDPDRACLTSAVFGAQIPEIDIREAPLELEHGDILVVASDGLLFLDEEQIATLIYENRELASGEIGNRLLERIAQIDHPDQDNVSVCVLKIAKGVEFDSLGVPLDDPDACASQAGLVEESVVDEAVVAESADGETVIEECVIQEAIVEEDAPEEPASAAEPGSESEAEPAPAAPVRTVVPTRAAVILQARHQGWSREARRASGHER